MGQGPEGTNVLMALNSLTWDLSHTSPWGLVKLSLGAQSSPSFVVGGSVSSLATYLYLAMGRRSQWDHALIA